MFEFNNSRPIGLTSLNGLQDNHNCTINILIIYTYTFNSWIIGICDKKIEITRTLSNNIDSSKIQCVSLSNQAWA